VNKVQVMAIAVVDKKEGNSRIKLIIKYSSSTTPLTTLPAFKLFTLSRKKLCLWENENASS
jgi:hypothetical protein